MNYNRKIMRLELSAEKALNGGYYYAELLLPAADYEIKDAMQRTRAGGRENTVEVSILECDILPELQDIRLDTFSLDELNFFAKRLASLPDEELPVFYAVTEQIFNDADENPVSIKDLINCTYGLDTVPVAHNVSNLAELGRFAFENELLSDLEGIPESAVPFLNAEQIGRVQQKNDNGVFEGRLYIPTVHYERPEVYDGVTLPEEEPENAAFLLKVGAYPKSAFSDEDPALHDLCLPADSDELFNVTDKCGEPEINLCFCYEFYSSIPQITSDMFDSMRDRPMEFIRELGFLSLNSRDDFAILKKFFEKEEFTEDYLKAQLDLTEILLPEVTAKEVRTLYSAARNDHDLRRAAMFLKLIRYSYSSGCKSFACQPFSLRTLFALVQDFAKRCENVVIENQDFETLIKHYDRPTTFTYCDPPYFTSEYVYDCGFTWEDHLRLYHALAGMKGKFLLSYNDCPEIRELYKEYNFFDFKRVHSMAQKYEAGKEFPELLIANYDLFERERQQPHQLTLFDSIDKPLDYEKILKENIVCRIKR